MTPLVGKEPSNFTRRGSGRANALGRLPSSGVLANRASQALRLPSRWDRTSIRDICSRTNDQALCSACISGACKKRRAPAVALPCGPGRIPGRENRFRVLRQHSCLLVRRRPVGLRWGYLRRPLGPLRRPRPRSKTASDLYRWVHGLACFAPWLSQ